MNDGDAARPGKDAKQSFEIESVMSRVREAVRPFPKAAMFALAEEGYASPFEQLIACLLSVRTRDEVSLPVAKRLFAVARSPEALAQLSVAEIDALITASSFHARKAIQIQAIAQRVTQEFGGELPCDRDVMASFAGIGPKCANLALGIACCEGGISVDIHVHRITNRWGYVHATSPERSMLALETLLPRSYWIEINALLVPFGKHICTGVAPKCSACPVLDMCRQVGVTSHR
ncbi:MAG: endonuclease III [Chloroflexia bacterium]|nr:endonuclease III [Chloroflexia bacterium]